MLNQRNNFARSWSVACSPWPAPRTTDNGRRATAHGFTLIEVMIAVALSLMLLYGINRVFSTTGDVIGLGNATMEANTQLRSAATALRGDFEGISTDFTQPPPAGTGIYPTDQLPLVIMNQRVQAWRNKREQADGGTMPAHRIDTVSFFSHGSFARQTGMGYVDGSLAKEKYTIDAKANDAWIWYGHVMLPDQPDDSKLGPLTTFMQQRTNTTAGNFNPPGYGNSIYAQDWVLGRMAILMYPRVPFQDGADTYHPIVSRTTGEPMPYLFRYFYASTPSSADLGPIAYDTPAMTSPSDLKDTSAPPPPSITALPYPAANPWRIQWSLCDLGSISDSGSGVNEISQTLAGWTAAGNWWDYLLYRFNCVPDIITPETSPELLTTANRMSLANPALIRGCTDFIVEFAGNFVTQDASTGNVSSSTPDSNGVLDYTYIDENGEDQSPSAGGSGVRRIQWYGLPRNDDPSVKVLPSGVSGFSHGMTQDTYGVFQDQDGNDNTYVSAWGPKEIAGGAPAPQLIRITIKVVDQRDQMQVPMTRQFIFKLR